MKNFVRALNPQENKKAAHEAAGEYIEMKTASDYTTTKEVAR